MNEIIENVYVGNHLDAVPFCISEMGIDVTLDISWISIDLEVTEKTIKEVEAAVNFLEMIYNAGKSVLVYCMAGIDRSPFIVALWMSRHFNKDIRDAYDLVKEKRPQTFQHWEWIEYFV